MDSKVTQEPQIVEVLPNRDQEMKNESAAQAIDENIGLQTSDGKEAEFLKPPEVKPKSNLKGEKNKANGEKTKEPKKSSKNVNTKNANTKETENILDELKDDFDIEELAKAVVNDNHNKMVHDILNQNNSRISSGKKKTNEKGENTEGPK